MNSSKFRSELRFNRRQCCAALGAAAGWTLAPGLRQLLADDRRRFPIGACDWSLRHRGELAAFKAAQQIGLDGVQFSFGAEDAPCDLRHQGERDRLAAASESTGVAVCSLGMGALNQVPYADHPDAERWVAECIDVMAEMKPNPRIVLIAFFAAGDINGDVAKQNQVIARLKKVAPAAERAGVVLGVESWLNVKDHLRILDAVGSPAVQVYYDVANMTKQGYDIAREIRVLGRERICQIHAKENGALLGQGKVDFTEVKRALDDIGWAGWLVIEGATVPNTSLIDCYRQNRQFLTSIFPT